MWDIRDQLSINIVCLFCHYNEKDSCIFVLYYLFLEARKWFFIFCFASLPENTRITITRSKQPFPTVIQSHVFRPFLSSIFVFSHICALARVSATWPPPIVFDLHSNSLPLECVLASMMEMEPITALALSRLIIRVTKRRFWSLNTRLKISQCTPNKCLSFV